MDFRFKFVIRAQKPVAAERHVVDLIRALGADVDQISLPVDGTVGDSFASQLFEGGALISSAETLRELLKRNCAGLVSLHSLASLLRFLLIYGLESCSRGMAELLFESEPIGLTPGATHHYHLPRAGRAVSGQLAGLFFDAKSRGECKSLFENEAGDPLRMVGDRMTPVIECDSKPFFAAIRCGGCEIFSLASAEVLNVAAPAPTGELPRESYPSLLPWLFFISLVAGDRCWRNPTPKACLIVDDAPLRLRYGFLSYAALLKSMHHHRFKTTIAFIPWAYSRSEPRAVDLFRQNRSMLSLCVHGCDHTEAEFAVNDIDALRQKARIACERMRLHQSATGIEWDRVMVFPEGLFSSASLLALQREGFLAAVNGAISSLDRPEINRIGDLLAPASISYAGVPIFKRHYPTDLLPFALDLFLGKQLLIGEHHTYFRAGCEEAAAFATQLSSLEPRLSWCSLGEAVCSAVQQRITASGTELRAYTDQIFFRQPLDEAQHCTLIKYETNPASVRGVTINGHPAEYRIAEGRVEVELQAQGEYRMDVLRALPPPVKAQAPSLSYKTRVSAQRLLGELRVNALTSDQRLLTASLWRYLRRALRPILYRRERARYTPS